MLMQPLRHISADIARSSFESDFRSVFIFRLLDDWSSDCIQRNFHNVKNEALKARRILRRLILIIVGFGYDSERIEAHKEIEKFGYRSVDVCGDIERDVSVAGVGEAS